jgi:hypothetical protein
MRASTSISHSLKELPLPAGFEKGVFTWYPVAFVAILAAFVARKWKMLLLLAGLIVPLVVLYGSWDDWSLAGEILAFVATIMCLGLMIACWSKPIYFAGMTREQWLKVCRRLTVFCSGRRTLD